MQAISLEQQWKLFYLGSFGVREGVEYPQLIQEAAELVNTLRTAISTETSDEKRVDLNNKLVEVVYVKGVYERGFARAETEEKLSVVILEIELKAKMVQKSIADLAFEATKVWAACVKQKKLKPDVEHLIKACTDFHAENENLERHIHNQKIYFQELSVEEQSHLHIPANIVEKVSEFKTLCTVLHSLTAKQINQTESSKQVVTAAHQLAMKNFLKAADQLPRSAESFEIRSPF